MLFPSLIFFYAHIHSTKDVRNCGWRGFAVNETENREQVWMETNCSIGFAPILCITRTKIIATAVVLTLSAPAQAMDCGALQPLAAMHDAYRALVSQGPAGTKIIAANQLLNTAPIFSANTFEAAFSDASLDLDTPRLEKVLRDGVFLARDVLAGRAMQSQIVGLHTLNADWLANTIARTGCYKIPFRQAQGTPVAQASPPEQAPPDIKNLFKKYTHVSRDLLPILILVLTGIACYLIYHSRHFRIKRIARLPRFSVAFKARAQIDDAQRNIIVLDISLGGSKIECDRALVENEQITLHLPCGSVKATIVWATAFYAGVMFDKQLSEKQLQMVLDDDGVTTRSRLSNVF